MNKNILTELFYRVNQYVSQETPTCIGITALAVANQLHLPSIAALLRIVCVLPVTSNEAERSFSRLKLLKTCLRSTMTNQRFVMFHLRSFLIFTYRNAYYIYSVCRYNLNRLRIYGSFSLLGFHLVYLQNGNFVLRCHSHFQ